MKIKVLIENTTDSDLSCEHGLSLYIEYKNKNILLDAGSTEAFAENAEQMGVDLAAVELAFLSHGHYDHSGGFGAFIRENKNAPVYAMESAMGRYASASGGSLHEIGVPEPVKEGLKDRLIKIDKVTQVTEGITLVPHNTPGLDKIGERAGLYVRRSSVIHCDLMQDDVVLDSEPERDDVALNSEPERDDVAMDSDLVLGDIVMNSDLTPDDFAHEMSLVLETEKGLVIFNSCSHGGVQNIIREVKEALPGKKIYAYIGGLHMKGKKDGEEICTFTEEEVKALADTISGEEMEVLLTGHCTGEPAIDMLEKYLPEGRILRLCTGTGYEM